MSATLLLTVCAGVVLGVGVALLARLVMRLVRAYLGLVELRAIRRYREEVEAQEPEEEEEEELSPQMLVDLACEIMERRMEAEHGAGLYWSSDHKRAVLYARSDDAQRILSGVMDRWAWAEQAHTGQGVA